MEDKTAEELLRQLMEEMQSQQDADSAATSRELRKKFLEQGLDDALRTHGITVDEEERKRLLNQLDADIFPM